jgi:NAD(P)H-quinone oxidoreductase subunit 5
MAGLILFVLTNVSVFSRRYLAGDRQQPRYYAYLLLLSISTLVMVFANHLLLFLTAWGMSNFLLVQLMIHKRQWQAASNAGRLALQSLGVGFLGLGFGFALLAQGTGTAFISDIVATTDTPPLVAAGLGGIAFAALMQSAAWPLHRWLLSSLNSPTPVSALMHAGLVNGGGFLLVRFAPLYLTQTWLLHAIFIAGLLTAVAGTFWKLLQTDIKRMLACSTMGQMGFMLMQCGMGLFAPAVSHLCWHGLFKAYLFLNAGSVVQDKRSPIVYRLTPVRLGIGIVTGIGGAWVFTLTSGFAYEAATTTWIMIGLAFMTASQLALGLVAQPLSVGRIGSALVVGISAGGLYGLSIHLLEQALAPLTTTTPQPLNALYGYGFAVIVLVWLGMILNLPTRLQTTPAWKQLYVTALNASQPHPQTITTTRTAYQS